MKFWRFMHEYGGFVFLAIFVAIVVAVVGLPVCIRLGREMWEWAFK